MTAMTLAKYLINKDFGMRNKISQIIQCMASAASDRYFLSNSSITESPSALQSHQKPKGPLGLIFEGDDEIQCANLLCVVCGLCVKLFRHPFQSRLPGPQKRWTTRYAIFDRAR